jgi:hypothetical protein
MPLIYLTQEQTEHPARHEMDAEQMAFVIQGIMDNENWMTNEELEAATDLLYDKIVAEKQTVPGILTLQ